MTVTRHALESLVQRGRTPLYTDLTALYQESLDALRESPRASNGDVLMTLKSIKFKERIRAIVFKHMGVKLKDVVVVPSSQINAMCVVEFTNDSMKKLSKVVASPGMVMEIANRMYDDKKAYLSLKEDVPAIFNFYIHTAFWRIRLDNNEFHVTAEEAAAITLHELGHVDHFIRRLWRMYGRSIDAGEIITYIQQNPDKRVILDVLAQIEKSKYFDKELRSIFDVTKKYFETTNSFDDPLHYEALSLLSSLVVAEQSRFLLLDVWGILGNNRDRVGSHNQDVDAERSADEFASRNGAYAALASAVTKLYKTVDVDAYLVYRQYMWKGPALFFSTATYFQSLFNTRLEEVSNGYDSVINRLNLIVETAKHAFSDPNLPSEIKTDLYSQIDQAERYINEYRSSKHRQMRLSIKQWKDKILQTGRIIVSPFHNRLSQDYGRLQDATRSASRHPLYYLSDKAR